MGGRGRAIRPAYLAVAAAIAAHATFDAEAAKALADEAERRLGALGVRPLRGVRAPFMRALTVKKQHPVALQSRLDESHDVEVRVYDWEDRRSAGLDRAVQRRSGPGAAGERGQRNSRAMIQDAIQTLLDGRDLGRGEAREVMGEIMAGDGTPAQIAGFLVALRAKGESVDEIAGCAEAMREHVLPVHPVRTDLVDSGERVGTGRARSTSPRPPRSSPPQPAPGSRSTATGR